MISFRERNPIIIGIASILGITIGLLFSFYLNKLPFIARKYELRAEFADAAGLTSENEVRVAGIKVGKIKAVELLKDRVLVTMEVQQDVDIPRAAEAEISLKTILGTKFVSIDARGKAPFFKDGETIPLDQTSIPFEIYQASNAGTALLQEIDAQQLNEGFKALAALTSDPNRNLARTLEGSAEIGAVLATHRGDLEALLVRGDELLATLDASSPDIQRLLSNGDKVLELLARRRATVQALLTNTNRLLSSFGGLLRENRREIDSILIDLHAVLVIVDANLGDLEQAVRLLGPSSESLSRITTHGPWADICIMALEASEGPVTAGVGTGTGDEGPVDCKPAEEP